MARRMDRFIRCQATTKSGTACKGGAMDMTPYCGAHQDLPHPSLINRQVKVTIDKDLVEKKYEQYRDEEAIAWVRSMGKPNV